MKKFKVILLILTFLLVLPFGVFAEEDASDVKEESKEVKVYLFYGDGCGFCEKAKTWFAEIEDEHGDKFELVKYEVWGNAENSKLMQAVAEARKEDAGGVPYIIIGNQSWDGFTEEYEEPMLAKIKSEYEQEVSERYDIMNYVELPGEEVKEDTTVRDILILLVLVGVVGLVSVGVIIARKQTN